MQCIIITIIIIIILIIIIIPGQRPDADLELASLPQAGQCDADQDVHDDDVGDEEEEQDDKVDQVLEGKN